MASEFKDDYSATLTQAIMVLKRLRKIAKPCGYTMSLFGSTLLERQGHDIDLICTATNVADTTAHDLAWIIITRHAKRLFMYHEIVTFGSDVWVSFLTHDNLYIDLHIKGVPDAKDVDSKARGGRRETDGLRTLVSRGSTGAD